MTSLNNQDVAFLFNTQKPISALHDDSCQQRGFREIVLGAKEEDAEQDLWLRLLDKEPVAQKDKPAENQAWINLYLGRSKTFKRGTSPKKHNVVVPIIPRCYATPDRDPAHAVKPPKGWIYIIRQFDAPQGTVVELWRELKSDGLGNFRDVKLESFKDLDHRKATGQPGLRIIVPYCIDKQVHHLWIAYSEVQWSWARVQNMKKDAGLRKKRMHKLDLSDCLNNFQNSRYTSALDGADAFVDHLGPLGQAARPVLDTARPFVDKAVEKLGDITQSLFHTEKAEKRPPEQQAKEQPGKTQSGAPANDARLYNLRTAPDASSRKLSEDYLEDIPVVYLDNPVGIGKALGKVYQAACNDMIQYVHLLESAPGILQGDSQDSSEQQDDQNQKADEKAPPTIEQLLKQLKAQPYDPVRWFASARILNRYLYTEFPDTPPDDWTDKQKNEFPKLKAQAEAKFLKYRKAVDKADIDKALGTEKRNQLRQSLRIAKGWLTDFLEEELITLSENSPLLQALDDFFTLPARIEGVRPRTVRKNDNDKPVTIWPDHYADGLQAVTAIIRYLDKHIYAHDADLVTPAPDGWELRKKDAGIKLLEKFADPLSGLPIHERLFPALHQGGDPTRVDRKTQIPDHEPAFKHTHFDRLEGDQFARGVEIAQKFARAFEEVVAMDDRSDAAYRQTIARNQQSIIRLANGVLNTNASQFRVPIPDILEFKKQSQKDFQGLYQPILFLNHTGNIYFEPINQALHDKANWNGEVSVKHQENRGIRGYNLPEDSPYQITHAIIRRTKDADNLTGLTATTDLGDEITFEPDHHGTNTSDGKPRNYDSIIALEMSDETRRRLFDRIGRNETCMKAVGGLIAVVETINLIHSLQAVMNNKNDDRRGELFADLLSSYGNVAGAMENLVEKGLKAEGDDVAEAVPKIGGLTDDINRATKAAQFLRIIGYVGTSIDIGLTLESLIENYQQNDDAYVGDAFMLTGVALTALGDVPAAAAPLAALVGLPVAWVTGMGLLLLLVGYLIKRFIFPEDTHFEIWLANGPFACGQRSHPHFRYSRRVEIITIADSSGKSLQKACTVHCYDNDWLYVDKTGTLVDLRKPAGHRGHYPKFRRDQTGHVYLKAGKHPNVEEDTRIGTIGEPFALHPLLQTETARSEQRFLGHRPGDDPMKYAQFRRAGGRKLFDDPDPDRHKRYRFAIWCEKPIEAFNALMDALYRPTITCKQIMRKRDLGEVSLHIHTPLILPTSNLFIQFWRLKSERVKSINDPAFSPKLTEDMIESYSIATHDIADAGNGQNSVAPRIKDLEDGPNRYIIRFLNHHTTFCRLRVRIDLFGDHETCLPCEPLFCDSDISTDSTEKSDKNSLVEGIEKSAPGNDLEKADDSDGSEKFGYRWVELARFFVPEWR